jgi:transposase
MAARAPKQNAPRRHWPPAEKRRFVELTLRPGASLSAIAREHGLYPNSLRQWKALYLAGNLEATSAPRMAAPAANATFVPVTIAPAVRRPQPAARSDAGAGARGSSVLQLVLASGASLRIETDALDAALVCALVAELRR